MLLRSFFITTRYTLEANGCGSIMRIVTKIIAGLFGGFIMAIMAAICITITFAASPEKGGNWGAIGFFIFWVIGMVAAFQARTAGKAWRRLLIASSVLSFLLPISAVIYTGSFIATNDAMDPSRLEGIAGIAGAAFGGGLLSGFMGFVGFFLGVVFLIIGLLVGRDQYPKGNYSHHEKNLDFRPGPKTF